MHQPAQNELAGVCHGPEIELCRERCCKDLGLFLGLSLFGDFLLPFEITSLVLLVAMVGAIVLAKRES